MTDGTSTSHGGAAAGTIWLTGLPAAGKTTIANACGAMLRLTECACVLDGDELRQTISRDLGFDEASRHVQAERAAALAIERANEGCTAVVALVSPFASARAAARRMHEHADIPFVEVYVATPAAICMGRDPKGLWARATSGELTGLTGFDAPYEPPTSPEVVVPHGLEPDAAAERVIAAFRERLRASAGSRCRTRRDRRTAARRPAGPPGG